MQTLGQSVLYVSFVVSLMGAALGFLGSAMKRPSWMRASHPLMWMSSGLPTMAATSSSWGTRRRFASAGISTPKSTRHHSPSCVGDHVVLKPAPADILDLYLGSLTAVGFDLNKNDVRFVEDDWENPTLGCWGLGWEVWLNGMEVTQFTYFQQVGGIDCRPITGEITYGLERLCMYLQGVENVFDLEYADGIKYGDVFHQNEVEQSAYNFEHSDVDFLLTAFDAHEKTSNDLMTQQLALPSRARQRVRG